MEDGQIVVYHFADGTKQIVTIGRQTLFDQKGRRRTQGEIHSIFSTTAHDLGAVSFEL